MPNPWLILAVVAALGGAWWHGNRTGYDDGQSDCEATHNQEALDRITEFQKLERDRIALRIERDRLAIELESQAHADPVVVERCLSPSRVRRLNEIK